MMAPKPFRFAAGEQVLFYLSYFARKVFCLWVEVKRPKLRMFVYEMLYSAAKFVNYGKNYPSPFRADFVETVFGKFRVRPRTADMSNVSPAFERRDMDFLLGLLGKFRDAGRRVLFLDIGADIGTFAVTVANRFRDYEGLRVIAFEPAAESFALLVENISLNGLDGRVEACNLALYGEDGRELVLNYNPLSPGSSGLLPAGSEAGPEMGQRVKTKTLDSVLVEKAKDYDALVIKLDVEGVESEVLRGGRRIFSSGKETSLLVEDFVNPEVVDTLQGMGAEFLAKLTPYNSFWRHVQGEHAGR